MPKGNQEAGSFVVELYGLLAKAGRPVSIVEIREKLTGHFRADAYEWWTKKRDDEGEDTPDAYWTPRNKATAWAAWIDYKIAIGAGSKWWSVQTVPDPLEGERPSYAKITSGVERWYVANPDKPPKIRVPVTTHALVEWSPQAVEQQRQGMYGLQYDEARKSSGELKSLTKEKLVRLLELADKSRGL